MLVSLLKKDVLMWTILKVLVTVLCMFWFSGHKARGTLCSRPGIKPAHPTLEGKVSTTKSLTC